jgi:hypothetical protein
MHSIEYATHPVNVDSWNIDMKASEMAMMITLAMIPTAGCFVSVILPVPPVLCALSNFLD